MGVDRGLKWLLPLAVGEDGERWLTERPVDLGGGNAAHIAPAKAARETIDNPRLDDLPGTR